MLTTLEVEFITTIQIRCYVIKKNTPTNGNKDIVVICKSCF